MRRSYKTGTNSNDVLLWEADFTTGQFAPTVGSGTYTINTGSGRSAITYTIDATKGLSCSNYQTTSGGVCLLRYDLTAADMVGWNSYSSIRTEVYFKYTYMRSVPVLGGTGLCEDWTDTTNANAAGTWYNVPSTTSFVTYNPMGVPTNTWFTLSCRNTLISSTGSTAQFDSNCWNDYNSNTYYKTSTVNNLSTRERYLQIFYNWGASNGMEGSIKTIRIYGEQ